MKYSSNSHVRKQQYGSYGTSDISGSSDARHFDEEMQRKKRAANRGFWGAGQEPQTKLSTDDERQEMRKGFAARPNPFSMRMWR